MRQHILLVVRRCGTYHLPMQLSELRNIKKVELHRHLELCLRHSTLREVALSKGIQVPSDPEAFKKAFLVTEPMKDLESVLKKFLTAQRLLDSEEILTRLTFEAIEDAFNEGILILELRYAPTFIQVGHPHLTFEKIHQAILKGAKMAAHLPIAVGFIAIIQRILPFSAAEQVTHFALDHRDSFVALDLADNEVGFEPRPFAPLFEKAKVGGLHITVHSGEADLPNAPELVRDSIEMLGAERIGHGLQIHRSPKMIEFVKSKRVALELCPTSNWLTNAVTSLSQHPFKKLMDSGVLVTVNSDDPGIFDLDLTNEYQVLHREFNIDAGTFDCLNDIAAAFSFIPLSQKQKVWPRPIDSSLAPWAN